MDKKKSSVIRHQTSDKNHTDSEKFEESIQKNSEKFEETKATEVTKETEVEKSESNKKESLEEKESGVGSRKSEDNFNHKHHKPTILDIEISTKAFIMSHLSLLIAGLIFVFGFNYLLNQGYSLSELTKYNPVTKTPSSFSLEINQPDDEILVFDKNVVLTGQTGPQSSVIIKIGDQTFAVEATKLGDFNRVLALNSGLNILEITSFDDKGNTKTIFRTVYYSEEKI